MRYRPVTESAILTPPPRPRIPPTPRLEQTALHLQARGDSRNLICFVERWAEVAEVTPRARFAQALAFLDLGLADRAWIRLQELGADGVAASPALASQHVDVQLATARMFLARAWRDRARDTLEAVRGSIDDRRRAAFADLEALLAAPPAELPEVPPESETRAEVLLPLAQRLLLGGSFLNAQRVLERLRKLQPDLRRVDDLLWGVRGDFSGGRFTLASYVDRFGPDMPTISDHGQDEAEHTESFGRKGALLDVAEADGESSGGFPSLFRNLGQSSTRRDDTEEAEITQASHMVPLPTMPAPGKDDRGDTQIARVIHNEAGPQRVSGDGPMHEPHAIPEAFDLAAFRREMGMDGDLGPDRAIDSDLEAEDDARVELRPEPSRVAARVGPTDAVPDIKLRASIEAEIAHEQAPVPEPPKVTPASAGVVPARPAPPVDTHAATPEMVPRAARAPRRSASAALVPLWLLAVTLVLLLIAVLLVALLAVQMMWMTA